MIGAVPVAGVQVQPKFDIEMREGSDPGHEASFPRTALLRKLLGGLLWGAWSNPWFCLLNVTEALCVVLVTV